jgi:hypothetical protein
MAYFAQIDEDGTVLDVISISNSDAPDPAPEHSEPLGQAFIAALAENDPRLEGTWIQTSFSGRIRKQYAGKGYRYDAKADVFIASQPFPSWTLDANHDWQAPTPMPAEGGPYYWDEATLSWVPIS